MAKATLNEFFRRLTRGMAAHTLGEHSDQQLIERALGGHDEAAFQAIVHRHGPMVFRVCWRILRHAQDVEDAFQATFLVFAQKMRALRKHASLASWLHTVAHRLALKSKAQSAMRQHHEQQASRLETLRPDDSIWGNLLAALDSELGQLPDKWRLPLILCYLQGRTQDESAHQLGWSNKTLRRRLQEARTALGCRLKGRGLGLPVALSAALLSDCMASSAPASELVASTVEAALQVVSGQQLSSCGVPARVATLVQGGVMLTSKKSPLILVLAFLIGTIGVGASLWAAMDAPSESGTDSVMDTLAMSHKQVQVQPQPKPKSPLKYFTNSLGMKFVWIEPGTFVMGSPSEEKERGVDEIQHKVTLTKGFYMGVHTVTQEQWQAITGFNPSKFRGDKNLPMEQVSWNDCQVFIQRLRERDKKPYRLPTEAEWEYACRAGSTTPFHFGEMMSTDQANFDGDLYRGKTTPVGGFPANAWGLHDIHGNVFQWCQDWYGPYPQHDAVDPQGPEKGEVRILRGGAWGFQPWLCRSASRCWVRTK